jgi:hypothetical protein
LEVAVSNIRTKIAIACFLGGSIGSLVALQLVHYLWWIGLIVGALVGYISYSFKEIPTTAYDVWQKMPERQALFQIARNLGRIALILICWLLLVLASVGAFAIIVVNICVWLHLALNVTEPPSWMLSCWFCVGSTVYMLAFGFILILADDNDSDSIPVQFGWLVVVASPGIFPLFITGAAVAGAVCIIGIAIILCGMLCILAMGLTTGLSVILAKVTWRTLLLTHSDWRLLCMTDAFFGTLAGHHFNSVIVGGMAGMVFGLLNYEVVSKRLLRRWINVPPAPVQA